MRRLKIILQSNLLYYLLVIFILIHVLLRTIIIKYESVYNGNETEFIGKISNIVVKEEYTSFILHGKEKLKTFYYGKIDIEPGTIVKVIGSLKKPSNNTIPNNFNNKKYLYNNQIYYTLNSKEIVKVKGPNIFNKIRNHLFNRCDYNEKMSGYLKLFIFGNKNDIDENYYELFKTNGIVHLIAISGMHISLLVLLLRGLFFFMKDTPRFLIISIILFFYTFLTGFSISVVRAVLSYIFHYINDKVSLKINGIQILILILFVILLINPWNIYSLAFKYSFIISFGIILSDKYIKGNYLKQIFSISLIALLYSLPISINLNYQIDILSLIKNLIMVPYVTFILYPLCLISYIILPFCHIAIFFSNIFIYLNNILSMFSCQIIIPKMPVYIIVIYYFFLILFSKYNNKYLFVLIILLMINMLIPHLDSSFYYYALDVGQGDENLLIYPNKSKVLLVDCGGIYNKKISNSLITFLHSIGITKIDELIISHGDYDHMGEAINIVNSIKVKRVIFNCGPYNDLEKELIKELNKKNIKYHSCIKELNVEKSKLLFLQTKIYDNENDNSNVIYTEYNSYKFMLMGDASITTEKEIINKYNLPKVDVLKVGHHGSKTSSDKEFIDEINPRYSIISVGKNNKYGHPNKEVMDNLKYSKTYRTDQKGSIMFKVKRDKLIIKYNMP